MGTRDAAWATARAQAFLDAEHVRDVDRGQPLVQKGLFSFVVEFPLLHDGQPAHIKPACRLVRVSRLTGRASFEAIS